VIVTNTEWNPSAAGKMPAVPGKDIARTRHRFLSPQLLNVNSMGISGFARAGVRELVSRIHFEELIWF